MVSRRVTPRFADSAAAGHTQTCRKGWKKKEEVGIHETVMQEWPRSTAPPMNSARHRSRSAPERADGIPVDLLGDIGGRSVGTAQDKSGWERRGPDWTFRQTAFVRFTVIELSNDLHL